MPNAHQSTDCWMGGGKQENYSSCTSNTMAKQQRCCRATARAVQQRQCCSPKKTWTCMLQTGNWRASRPCSIQQNIAQARFKPPKIELSASGASLHTAALHQGALQTRASRGARDEAETASNQLKSGAKKGSASDNRLQLQIQLGALVFK